MERALEARPIFIEAGYSRAVLAGGWKLILKLPAAATTPGAATGCTNPHGDPMAGYLRELARVTAAARAAAGPGANASAKVVFSAVTAARKGVERRDLEVRLLYSSFLRHPASYCDAVQLFDTGADPGELRSLAGDTGEAARQITLLATMLTAFVARHEPQSAFKLPLRQEWRSGSVVPAGLSSVEPWK